MEYQVVEFLSSKTIVFVFEVQILVQRHASPSYFDQLSASMQLNKNSFESIMSNSSTMLNNSTNLNEFAESKNQYSLIDDCFENLSKRIYIQREMLEDLRKVNAETNAKLADKSLKLQALLDEILKHNEPCVQNRKDKLTLGNEKM
ncbi:hypothetical protein GJ496_001480 [Pomphorhynchus laevis]|nr:hypothetical protein GJ496_001480 [Pomphorhynchus laevis]